MSAVEEKPPATSRRRLLFAAIPVGIFGLLVALFALGLTGEGPSKVPSALLNKPVPDFELAALEGVNAADGSAIPGLADEDLKTGRISLVNVWASWCAPCRQEHPLLMRLGEEKAFDVIGINYKDKPENARRFLGTLGLPYRRIGIDPKGRATVDWGVYGVPETFLVDGKGVIRHKWIGPINEKAVREKLAEFVK